MLHHTAEIVAVGTELLLGSIANTNAQYLSQELNALGIGVCYHTVVGDNPERLRKVLAIARERADIVITTGGLGPTYDDLTKTVVAESFGRKLVYHPEIEEIIRRFFETSILPFEDCCTVFTPRHPNTRPRIEDVAAAESALDVDALIQKALSGVQRVRIKNDGTLVRLTDDRPPRI